MVGAEISICLHRGAVGMIGLDMRGNGPGLQIVKIAIDTIEDWEEFVGAK
jgi:hypothetical protein